MSRYVTVGVVLSLLVGLYFFLQPNDEKYIKKTTLQIIDQMVQPANTSKMAAILRRIRNITEPMHFSIKVIFSRNNEVIFKENSVSQVRTLLGSYFKNQPRFRLKTLKQDDLNFSIQDSGNQKTAQLSFLLQGGRQERSYSCKVRMGWRHEKDWKIYKIEGSKCKNLNLDY